MDKSHNWQVLERLRAVFLDDAAETRQKDYWHSQEVLDLYDQTFAQRIGWKWQGVLQDLCKRKFELHRPTNELKILDWGCGTGIATRTVLKTLFSANHYPEVTFLDRSPKAMQFAADRVRKEFPEVKINPTHQKVDTATILLVSHVINELDEKTLASLLDLIRNAGLTIWVEAGTHEVSHKLINVRETLKAEVNILAPCPHTMTCPFLATEMQQHWCHQFAKPPTEVFHSAFWNAFSKALKIDLRSLPLSYLVLGKNKAENISHRLIGRPKKLKPEQKLLLCSHTGHAAEYRVKKREHPAWYKTLDDVEFDCVFPESILQE